MKAKFKNGEYIAPVVPIGYKINPAEKNRLVVDEETMWIVERIFELAAHGYGANKICRTLAAEKAPIPAWWVSQKNVKRPKEDWMRIENTHEPLVDRETWDLVQGHINSRKRSRKDDEPQIFVGLLKCGDYLIPGLKLSDATEYHIGKYGRMRQRFSSKAGLDAIWISSGIAVACRNCTSSQFLLL
jgi:hypothetical protein